MAFTYSYSTIADSAIDPDSPIDTALMTAIRNNIVYVYEYVGGKSYTPAEPHNHNGTNSAPVSITAESQLSASIVSQGKLKTALQQAANSIGAAAGSTVALTGGTYTLMVTFADNSTGPMYFMSVPSQSTYTGSIAIYNPGAGSQTYWLQARYVQASPPNNFGDGDVPLLAYAVMRPDGTIAAVDVAEDTPWYYNGPHRINPHTVFERDGRKFRRVRQLFAEHGTLRAARQAGLPRRIILDRLATDPLVEEEITFAVKNRDMAVIPHPFRNVAPGNTVVLLDPVSPLCERLLLLHQAGDPEETVSGLLLAGDLRLDNTALARRCPPGVMPVGCRWRNTP